MLAAASVAASPASVSDAESLRTHLCTAEHSPLDALSVGGKLRLLESLRFHERANQARHVPLVDDLTEDEKASVVALLRLEAYRNGPPVRRARSAGFDTAGLPDPNSAYCRGEASVSDWAMSVRKRHEGALSAAIGAAAREIDAAPNAPGAREAVAAMAYTRVLNRPRFGEEFAAAPPVVAREVRDGLAFWAAQTEAPELLAGALRLVPDDGEHAESLALIRLIKARQDEPLREDGLRVVYRADEAGRLAGTETDAAPKVVLVASRHCGFSRAALEAIAADGETSALMASHGLVLAGPGEDVTSPWHREWAKANPGLAVGSVALKSRWPGVSFAETPVVFLVDGEDARPVLIGWRAEESAENVAALRRALEEVARAEAP